MTFAEITVPYATAIAEEAFVLTYPLLRIGRETTHQAERLNVLTGTRDAPDTLRFSAWLDLGPEPVVLSMPDTCGRYYVVWLRDAWNRLSASGGARAMGTGPRALALLGPGRNATPLPAGVMPVAMPTRLAHVTGRIEALAGSSGDDLITAGFRLSPLSRWRDRGAGAVAMVEQPEAPSDPPDARTFFTEVFRLIGDNPPGPDDRVWLDRLCAVAPLQEARAWEKLAPDLRRALDDGVRRGLEVIRAAAGTAGAEVGTWRITYDAGQFDSDHLRRAVAARTGIGADPAIDELIAVTRTDSDDLPLDGRHRYTLRFAPDATPPANGFWSLTTTAVERPGDSYVTGDLCGLALDRDGSLPIHVQHRPPMRERRANWLPAPPGRFDVVLRLHWPGREALERRWTPPSLTRVEPPRG